MTGVLCAIAGTSSGPIVSLFNYTVSSIDLDTVAVAAYQLASTSVINEIIQGAANQIGNWIVPASGMSGYETRATVTAGGSSGGTFTGTTGSWLNLGTTRTWNLSNDVSGAYSYRTLTVEIRDASTLSVLTSATITIETQPL